MSNQSYPSVDWSPDQVKAFWDHYSQKQHIYFAEQVGMSIWKIAAPFLKGKNKVLDYGCGNGSMIDILLSREVKVAGIDSSNASIAFVNQRFKEKPNFLGASSVEDLLSKQMTFNVIFALEVIEHMKDPELNTFVHNINSLLSTNGIVVITTPNEERLEDSYLWCPNCKHQFHRMQHVRSWSKDSLKSFMNSNGLHTLKTFTTTLYLYQTMRGRLKLALQNWLKPDLTPANLILIAEKP